MQSSVRAQRAMEEPENSIVDEPARFFGSSLSEDCFRLCCWRVPRLVLCPTPQPCLQAMRALGVFRRRAPPPAYKFGMHLFYLGDVVLFIGPKTVQGTSERGSVHICFPDRLASKLFKLLSIDCLRWSSVMWREDSA